MVWALVSRREQFATVVRAYRFAVPLFLLAVPAIWIMTSNFSQLLPGLPGAPVPIVTMKAGDIGVHLAGAAAFILLGLYRGRARSPRIPETVLWTAWALAFLIVVVTNRAGFLSASVGLAAVVVLRPSMRMLSSAVAGGLLLAILVLANPTATVNGREFSPSRVTERAASIFDREGERQGTINWRLDWWDMIIGYTFEGEHFWTGKGFGANLAEEDGFLGQAQGLRSPHNATMTALARGGVPGLVFWLSFHITFGITMLKAYSKAQRRRDLFWAPILAWILIYWGAGMVNGSFDVYWEGPQGAIWMWTIMGLGLAALEVLRREDEEGVRAMHTSMRSHVLPR
jgi:O-antigen ligase